MNWEPINPTPTGCTRLISDTAFSIAVATATWFVVGFERAERGADHACLGSEPGSAYAQTTRVRSPRIARKRGTKGRPISSRRGSQATAQHYERGIQCVRDDRDMNGQFRGRCIDDVAGDARCGESRAAHGDRVGLLQTERLCPTQDAWPGGAHLEGFTIGRAVGAEGHERRPACEGNRVTMRAGIRL